MFGTFNAQLKMQQKDKKKMKKRVEKLARTIEINKADLCISLTGCKNAFKVETKEIIVLKITSLKGTLK